MSDKLNLWIKQQLKLIPAIPALSDKAKKLISNEHYDIAELSHLIALDPGLSSQLFNQINAKRKGAKREYLESIQSSLSLLGHAAVKTFISSTSTLDDIRTSFACENDYLPLVVRAHHSAHHAKLWAKMRGSQGIKEVGIATKLFDIAEYALCLFDHSNFQTYLQLNLTEASPNQNCLKVWGFTLQQLSDFLCQHWHLPELVREAHAKNIAMGARSKGIKIATDLTRHADISWYQQAMDDCIIKAADLCQKPFSEMCSIVHSTSIVAAQETLFEAKFHSASNLVQYLPHVLEDRDNLENNASEQTPPPVKTEPDLVINHNELFISALKRIATHQDTNQALQLKALLEGNIKFLNLNRSALFLLNQQHTKLSTRLHSGLDSQSALLKFSIIKEQAGLLKALLDKPQAIWINPTNYARYEKLLPGLFKSCTMSKDFFLMSLFSGKRALGIVFSDNYQHTKTLEKEQFLGFKQAVNLTSKAMLIISQRNKKQKASQQ